jgi:hypothetical protein
MFALLGLILVTSSFYLAQVWSHKPKTVEARYTVGVEAGNYSASYVQLRLPLFPYLNGSMLHGCESGADLSPGKGYVNVTFHDIKPHTVGYCQFSVQPFETESPEMYGASEYRTGIQGNLYFTNDLTMYRLERIVIVVSVLQNVGFTSFLTVTESLATYPNGASSEAIRYSVVQDFTVLLIIVMAASAGLLCAKVLTMPMKTRRLGGVIIESFPYLTICLFVITTLIYIYVGLVDEPSISAWVVSGFTTNRWFNYVLNSPTNVFFHYNSSHFEGNMYFALPWNGVMLGLLPLGFLLESILRVRRSLMLAVYLLTPYAGIVGIRYGSLFGYGASLSVFGLAGLCVVAAYYSLHTATLLGRARRILLFAVVLYVGYSVIAYLSGYVFPVALWRFTGLISVGNLKADAISHILAIIVPLTLIALYVRANPSKLFR